MSAVVLQYNGVAFLVEFDLHVVVGDANFKRRRS